MAVRRRELLVEAELLLATLDNLVVGSFKVLGEDDVAIFPDCLEASFLADGGDVGGADLFGASDVYGP